MRYHSISIILQIVKRKKKGGGKENRKEERGKREEKKKRTKMLQGKSRPINQLSYCNYGSLKKRGKKKKGKEKKRKARAHRISSHRQRKKKKDQPTAPLRMSFVLTYLPTLRHLTSARQKAGHCNTMIWNSSDRIHRSAELWLLRKVAS